MKIYVASSWRNILQPEIVRVLRELRHDVYDFKNPAPGNTGFSWKQIDGGWESWTPEQYRAALRHPIAKAGYALDISALQACDACVLVLPSGRSASWEFGYAMGQEKRGAVVQFDKVEPELMYSEAEIICTMEELQKAFAQKTDGVFTVGDPVRFNGIGGSVGRIHDIVEVPGYYTNHTYPVEDQMSDERYVCTMLIRLTPKTVRTRTSDRE